VFGTPPFNLILRTASRKCFGFSGPVSSHSFITSSARTQHTCWYNLQLSCRTESCSLKVYNTYNAVKNQTRYISRKCNKYDPVSTTFSIGNCQESTNGEQSSVSPESELWTLFQHCYTCHFKICLMQWQVLLNNLGQVVYTYVPLSPSSITLYRPSGGDALRLGR